MYRQAIGAWSWSQTSGAWWPHRPSALQRVTYATAPPGQALGIAWKNLQKNYDEICVFSSNMDTTRSQNLHCWSQSEKTWGSNGVCAQGVSKHYIGSVSRLAGYKDTTSWPKGIKNLNPLSQLEHQKIIATRGVRKIENMFGFGFKITEPSKHLTSVQTVFRQKLHAICSSNKKWQK